MNDQRDRELVERAINTSLARMEGDPWLAQRLMRDAEGEPMKKRHWLGLALALTLLLAAATALAASVGLLDFLHLDEGVATVQPEWHLASAGDVGVEVVESASDGLSAHLLLRLTAQEGDALLVMEDTPQSTAFTADYAGKRALQVNPLPLQLGDAESELWPHTQYRYESATSVAMDLNIDLREAENAQDGDTLRIPIGSYTLAANGFDVENESTTVAETLLAIREASREVYTATNLPASGRNFLVESVQVVRTDMACYVDVAVRDDLSEEALAALESAYEADDYDAVPAISPLRGSFWLRVLDENGNAYENLNGGRISDFDDATDEAIHQTVHLFVQRFDVGDTLTLEPFAWELTEALDPITVTLSK